MFEGIENAKKQLLIAGEWCDGERGETFTLVNPATEEAIAEVAKATPRDIEAAVDSVSGGFSEWRSTEPWRRSSILRDAAELIRKRTEYIAQVLTAEQGKPLAEARGEVSAAADQFDWYADEARRVYGRVVEGRRPGDRILVLREPIGPVAALSTWNFPALLPSRKIAPALAAGCSVVVVPSEESPLTTLAILDALLDAGVPPNCIASVTGSTPGISDHLVGHRCIRKVSLTGSLPVGRTVYRNAAEGIKDIALELGGHAPVVVWSDVDVKSTAFALVKAKFRNSGQVCASPSRFFVHEDVFDEFVSYFVRAAKALVVGDGSKTGTEVGPLSNSRRIDAAEKLILDAVSNGAVIECGGTRSGSFRQGYFFEPTVLTNVSDTALIMKEEPFAPVAPVCSFSRLDEVLMRANSVDYGLAAYVFTQNLGVASALTEGLDVGMVAVNHTAIAAAEAPFGGVKHSGFGREGGAEGISDYTVTKYVSIAT